jgi:hypothetical protein
MTPYEGSSKILLGINIGTTSSTSLVSLAKSTLTIPSFAAGVALAHLAPGATPSIRSVQKWSGAPNESKIPSLVYVLSNGTPTPIATSIWRAFVGGHQLTRLSVASDDLEVRYIVACSLGWE